MVPACRRQRRGVWIRKSIKFERANTYGGESPVKAAAALVKGAESLCNFIIGVAQQIIPEPMGGKKEVIK